MSVLLDEDTIVTESLDFAPPCDKQGPAHAATLALICRGCGRSVLLCDEHLARFRAWIEQNATIASAFGTGHVVECRSCLRTAPTLDELVRVEPV